MSLLNGAGTCASYEPAQTLYNVETGEYETIPAIVTVGISKSDALAYSNMAGGHWCCSSCNTASWLE